MKKTKFWYFLFLIPVFLVIFSWFSSGKIISNNSEENLNILSPSRTESHFSTFWWPIGTGTKIPFQISREPVFMVLSLMEKAGIPSFLIQVIFIGSIMLVGMISMYAFTKYGLNLSYFVGGLSSLFYLFNIYSLTQVWKRFLYNGMISWAFLPLFLLLWFRWILDYKLKWLLLFLLSSLFFSYTFSHPAYLLTFWVPAAVLVLVRSWEFKNDFRKLLKLFALSIIGIISWIIVNFWWFIPTIFLSKSWTDENMTDLQVNFNIIHALSQHFPLHEVLLLRQSWYLGKDNDWNDFYHNPFIYLISIIVLIIVILGFIKLKSNFCKKYLSAIAIVGLFISKGTSFPFGYTFYSFLFGAFPFTSAIRNSYEKFGLVWVLSYSIFFAYGLYFLYKKSSGKFKFIMLYVMLVLVCGLLVYPMWNGDIFPPKHRVSIPTYYADANNYLNLKSADRVFHIPFVTEIEKISYDWGYVGEDPTVNLFDSETLSSPNASLYVKIYKLLPNFLNKSNFSNILALLGAQKIIFHQDYIYPKIDTAKIQNEIESWQGVIKTETFGKLTIYQMNPQIVKPRIYVAGSVEKVDSLVSLLDKVSSDKWREGSVFVMQELKYELKNNSIPEISFIKIANDKYIVNVKKSQMPYILIFNNTFDPSWKAKINTEILNDHFIVNGFANGWIVDKTGDYKIEIKLAIWPWD